MSKNIFEDMTKIIHCNFISDLRILNKKVYKKLGLLDFEQYDFLEVQKFFTYVFDIEISRYEDIEKFLK